VFSRALPTTQRPPAVDAYNVTVQRQLTTTLALEVGYVGNHGTHVFAGDGPALDINQATLKGYPDVPLNQRRPFYNKFGWTQGIDYFCNCATNRYDSLQTRLTKRFSHGYSAQANYTLQHVRQHGNTYFETDLPEHQGLYDSDLEYGPPDWDRVHSFSTSIVAELPFGRGRKYSSDVSPMADAFIGGWQFNTNVIIQSGLPFNVTYRNNGADRDTGPSRPNLIGNPDGPQTRDQWFNAAPIGSPNSAFGRPAKGTFGDLPRNALRGPGYWRADASLFKHFAVHKDSELEIRFEVVNILNHVNLGNPDSEVGVPENPNTNAGRINSSAYGNSDPLRQLQIGLKYRF
jgi:hypothetical protein